MAYSQTCVIKPFSGTPRFATLHPENQTAPHSAGHPSDRHASVLAFAGMTLFMAHSLSRAMSAYTMTSIESRVQEP
jgi:hypothetical protein